MRLAPGTRRPWRPRSVLVPRTRRSGMIEAAHLATALLGRIEMKRGHWDEAAALLERSLSDLDPSRDPATFARFAAEFARTRMIRDFMRGGCGVGRACPRCRGPGRAVEVIAEAIEHARRLPPGTRPARRGHRAHPGKRRPGRRTSPVGLPSCEHASTSAAACSRTTLARPSPCYGPAPRSRGALGGATGSSNLSGFLAASLVFVLGYDEALEVMADDPRRGSAIRGPGRAHS